MATNVTGSRSTGAAVAKPSEFSAQTEKAGSAIVPAAAGVAALIAAVATPPENAAHGVNHAHPPEVPESGEPWWRRLLWMSVGVLVFNLGSQGIQMMQRGLHSLPPVCYVVGADGKPIAGADVVANGESNILVDVDEAHRFVVPGWRPGHRIKVLSARGPDRRRGILAEGALRRHEQTGEYYLEFVKP